MFLQLLYCFCSKPRSSRRIEQTHIAAETVTCKVKYLAGDHRPSINILPCMLKHTPGKNLRISGELQMVNVSPFVSGFGYLEPCSRATLEHAIQGAPWHD